MPSAPTPLSSLAITGIVPAIGSTVVIPPQYPYNAVGGVVLPPGSGLISVNLAMSVSHDVPWAQLNVYLLTDGTSDRYCGQNLPDSPTWQFLSSGWRTSVTVTGFQIYRVPCDVTGVRAMLHMRNNGLLVPPTSTETIAESTTAMRFRLLR